MAYTGGMLRCRTYTGSTGNGPIQGELISALYREKRCRTYTGRTDPTCIQREQYVPCVEGSDPTRIKGDHQVKEKT